MTTIREIGRTVTTPTVTDSIEIQDGSGSAQMALQNLPAPVTTSEMVYQVNPWTWDRDETNEAAEGRIVGTVTSHDVLFLANAPAGPEYLSFVFTVESFAGPQGDWTLEIPWTSETATTGQVVFAAAVASWVQGTETTAIGDIALGAEQTVTTSHPGGTAKRPLRASITIPNAALQGAQSGRAGLIRLYRKTASETGGLAGNVILGPEPVSLRYLAG